VALARNFTSGQTPTYVKLMIFGRLDRASLGHHEEPKSVLVAGKVSTR
jgi:hypothetical protein